MTLQSSMSYKILMILNFLISPVDSTLNYLPGDTTWPWAQYSISVKLKQVKLNWAPRSTQPKLGTRKTILQEWSVMFTSPTECILFYKNLGAKPNMPMAWKWSFLIMPIGVNSIVSSLPTIFSTVLSKNHQHWFQLPWSVHIISLFIAQNSQPYRRTGHTQHCSK